jgi:hypothetical protein
MNSKSLIAYFIDGTVFVILIVGGILAIDGSETEEQVTVLRPSDPDKFTAKEKEYSEHLFGGDIFVDVVTAEKDTLKAVMVNDEDKFVHMQVPVEGVMTPGKKFPIVKIAEK